MLTLTKAQYEECKKEFLKLEERAIYMNHYQLARETNIENPTQWKAFLTDPRTIEFTQSEMNLIRTAAINDIIQKAPNSKSVGQAQLINSLLKIEESTSTKDGPVFIYCYVPLNDEQKHAPNVKEVDSYGREENEEEWTLTDDMLEKAKRLPD